MENPTFAEMQTVIVMAALMAIFAYQGYRRGTLSELVKMGIILLGVGFGDKTLLGSAVIKAINGIHKAFLFLFNGGLQAILSGNVEAEAFSAIFDKIKATPKLISADNQELAMFLLMIGLIFIGYVVSSAIKGKRNTLAGLILGFINGVILAWIFLPLLPKSMPQFLSQIGIIDLSGGGVTVGGGASGGGSFIGGMWGVILAAIGLILNILLLPFRWLLETFGAWTIPLLIILLVLFIGLRRVRKAPPKKAAGSRT